MQLKKHLCSIICWLNHIFKKLFSTEGQSWLNLLWFLPHVLHRSAELCSSQGSLMPSGISSDLMIPGRLYPGTGASSMSCSLLVLILCFAAVHCLVILIALRGGPHHQLLCQPSGMCCCRLWWAVRMSTCARMQRSEGERINRRCLFLSGEWSHMLLRRHVGAAAVVGLLGVWVALMYWRQMAPHLILTDQGFSSGSTTQLYDLSYLLFLLGASVFKRRMRISSFHRFGR